jgi:NTP pyrophosphatase (non-canonical NTP hydrolase)
MDKTLNELRDEIHENAVKHGFYDTDLQLPDFASKTVEAGIKHALFAQRTALIHSELSEALEADRKDIRAYTASFLSGTTMDGIFNDLLPEDVAFEKFIKNTVEDELADVIIRTLDLCGHLGIDIERHIELKMKYNESRGYRHGKKTERLNFAESERTAESGYTATMW